MKTFRVTSILAAGLFASQFALAATETANFGVEITIAESCEISNPPGDIDFGSTTFIDANIDQTTSVSVRCTKDTGYDIKLSSGASGDVTAREMQSGGEAIPYLLSQDPAHSSNWGESNGTDTVGGIATGQDETHTIHARVEPQATTPAAGTYSDTITLTVSY